MTRWARPAALIALVLALAGFGAREALAWHGDARRASDGRSAVAAAEREVVALISVSAATSAQDLAKLRAGATGAFRSQLAEQSSTFTTALRKAAVSAHGSVVSAGLASLSGSRATVLLAASGTVRNNAAAAASSRTYRLRAELSRTGGRWLVSSLEFVS